MSPPRVPRGNAPRGPRRAPARHRAHYRLVAPLRPALRLVGVRAVCRSLQLGSRSGQPLPVTAPLGVHNDAYDGSAPPRRRWPLISSPVRSVLAIGAGSPWGSWDRFDFGWSRQVAASGGRCGRAMTGHTTMRWMARPLPCGAGANRVLPGVYRDQFCWCLHALERRRARALRLAIASPYRASREG